ncbi:unnamed protein product [Orchesella dallaii]|uniref:Core Histone H2A/H2B/H3 domain-containing protein n=1 Tax=Orchesella dallaii TaxID=48710 RepID=A0ABP1PVR0_9HEXA
MNQSPTHREATPLPRVRGRIFAAVGALSSEVGRDGASTSTGGKRGATRATRNPREICKHYGISVRKIAFYERCTEFSISRMKFQRLVGDIIQEVGAENSASKMSVKALAALQLAAEEHIVSLFGDSFLICMDKKRKTVTPKDLWLARKIRGTDTFK